MTVVMKYLYVGISLLLVTANLGGKCLPREKSRAMKKIETILKSGVSTTEILQSINRIQMEREEYHV